MGTPQTVRVGNTIYVAGQLSHVTAPMCQRRLQLRPQPRTYCADSGFTVWMFARRPGQLEPAGEIPGVPRMQDQALACERRSHSSKPMRPRRASPNGTSERSSTRPPLYRASGSLTTSRGSPTAFR